MVDLAAAFDKRDLALIGCGKMGGALLEGWLNAGAPGARISILEPFPSPDLRARVEEAGARLSQALDDVDPLAVVMAVKPQSMADVMETASALVKRASGETMVVSIAAGVTIDFFESRMPAQAPIVRAMPNTPSAVGRGATALFANEAVSPAGRDLAEALLSAVGVVTWLEREDLMDAVTAVSGSGPAYVFHLIEALARAGVAEGLPEDLAMTLARATVAGAGELAHRSTESAAQLRVNVTSPGGTTAAGLAELMAEGSGLTQLMRRAVAAAANRSRELGG